MDETGRGIWVAWNVVTRGEPEWGTALARVSDDVTGPMIVPPGLGNKATNFASIALDRRSRPWVVWQERQPARRWNALAAVFDAGRWSGPHAVLEQRYKARQFAPCSASTGAGDIWIAWARSTPCAVRVTGERIESLEFKPGPSGSLWRVDDAPEYTTARGEKSRSVAVGGRTYSLYWGDVHNHTELSDGRQPPDHSLALAHDVYGYDFFSLADHDNGLTEGEWRLTQTLSGLFYEPKRFVTFSGYESSYQWVSLGAGHRNVCYPTDAGELCRFREGASVEHMLRCVGGNGGIAIPHHIGRSFAPIDWDTFDPAVQPLVEICSVHGVFEYSGNPTKPKPEYLPRALVDNATESVEGVCVRDGWNRGHRFGIIGSADCHRAHCFGVHAVALAAVYAEDLSRQSLFEAFRARRTYATTGVRAFLDFRAGGAFMGEEIRLARGKGVTVEVKVESPIDIRRIEIVRNGEVVFADPCTGRSRDLHWTDRAPPSHGAYYYARVSLEEDNFAWSSPVWVDLKD